MDWRPLEDILKVLACVVLVFFLAAMIVAGCVGYHLGR